MIKKDKTIIDYDSVIMPAQTITLDKVFKFKDNNVLIEQVEKNYFIAWFDRSKNTELFKDCEKVYFGLCNINELPEDFQNLNYIKNPDDVEFLDIYATNQSFERNKIRELISDYVKIFNITNLTEFSDFSNEHNDINHPDFLSMNSTDIKLGILNADLISKHTENMLMFAWTIKHNLSEKPDIDDNIPDDPELT